MSSLATVQYQYSQLHLWSCVSHSIKATARSILPRTVQLIEEVYLLLLESATFTADLLQFTEDTWRYIYTCMYDLA